MVVLREFNQNEKITLSVDEIFFHPDWDAKTRNKERNGVIVITKLKIPFKFFIITTCFRQFLLDENVKIPQIFESRPCDKIHEAAKSYKFIEIPFPSSKSGALYGNYNRLWFFFGFYSEDVIESKICSKKRFKSFKDVQHLLHCKELSLTTLIGSKASESFCPQEIIFEDNFNTLDEKIWKHENTMRGGGNWEFQWFVPDVENSFVRDGILHIKPTFTNDKFGGDFVNEGEAKISSRDCTDKKDYGCYRHSDEGTINPIRSASISTENSFAFKYGTVEIRAKVAAGDWLASTISLLPKDRESYGEWPNSGQIDLMEVRGNRNLFIEKKNIGVGRTGCTFHFGSNWETAHSETDNHLGFHSDFHIYKLVWTPTEMSMMVDDVEVCFLKIEDEGLWHQFDLGQAKRDPWKTGNANAPFDKEFYISFSLKAGGLNFFPKESLNPQPKPWSNTGKPHAATAFWDAKEKWSPTWLEHDVDFQIDYVKVTAL